MRTPQTPDGEQSPREDWSVPPLQPVPEEVFAQVLEEVLRDEAVTIETFRHL